MYPTWTDWDNDCQSNRHEVLIDEAQPQLHTHQQPIAQLQLEDGMTFMIIDFSQAHPKYKQITLFHYLKPIFGAWRWSSRKKFLLIP